jgi:UDP:flavonoid glycosyltransferase YjiC (YdhE family)
MRVLVTSVPQAGHLHPLLSLAKAFADQGDEVLVACAPGVAGTAAAAGLESAAVGTDFGEWWQVLAGRTRGAPGDGLPQEHILRYFTPRLFAEIGAPLTVDDLLRVAGEWRPDVIVADSFVFAAPLVSALLGVRYVHHLLGPAIDPFTLDLVTDALSPLWRSFGHDVPAMGGLYGDITLTICPPAIEPRPGPPGAQVLSLRPVPLDRSGPDDRLPDYVGRFGGRPLIYVTLGTLSNTDVGVFRAIIDGLSTQPVNAIVTIGSNNDPAELGALPTNVHVERYVPQSLLLPHCRAGVNHAGSGTMLGAFAHGLPQVVIPQGADNFVNADRAVLSGAALRLLPEEVDVETVVASLHRLLDEPGFGTAAAGIAAEIADMPTPADVAADLGHRLG